MFLDFIILSQYITGSIVFSAEKKFWGSVPAGDNHVCVLTIWGSKKLCQPEISQLQAALVVNEKIVGLEISVEDPVVVEVLETEDGLQDVGLDVGSRQDDTGILEDEHMLR